MDDQAGACQVVLNHLAAFNDHDTARLLATFAPMVWATGEDVFHGAVELAGLFNQQLWILRPSLEVLSLVCAGEHAAAELREVLSEEGELHRFAIGVFFHVQQGPIRRGRVYREGTRRPRVTSWRRSTRPLADLATAMFGQSDVCPAVKVGDRHLLHSH
jgi:hypothetical protein